MTPPQLENGYTKIANELVERFAKLNLSKYEWRLLWAILRKTYGWNKKSDRISVSQMQALTGLDRRNVSRTKRYLIKKNILVEDGEMIALNKDYGAWVLSSVETTLSIVYRDTRPWYVYGKIQSGLEGREQRCEWCFEVRDLMFFQRHHIVPRSRGGTDGPKAPNGNSQPNIARLCIPCHKAAHSAMDEWIVVNSDDMQRWYRHFVSLLSSVQTQFLSSLETQSPSSVETPQKTKTKDKPKRQLQKTIAPVKAPHGENGLVLLTQEEADKLTAKFGVDGALERVGGADLYFASKGNAGKYKNHYATILNWERMELKRQSGGGKKSFADQRNADNEAAAQEVMEKIK